MTGTHYVVTGAAGFLGWHTRARLATLPGVRVSALGRAGFASAALPEALAGADVVLHCAGINRGSDAELEEGNIALAQQLAAALERTAAARRAAGRAEPVVVFAGSNYASDHHPGRDTPYGRGKRAAGEVLLAWARSAGNGARAVDLRFCGLFGEHARPGYNSFVANFAHAIATGEQPVVTGDRELPLLPVGEAVARMLAAARPGGPSGVAGQEGTPLLISAVADRLARYHRIYAPAGEIPDLSEPLGTELFSALRTAMWPAAYPLRPQPRSDERGTLVEIVRTHGGGQAFVSTTNPGCTRGNHFHLAKFERFQVLSGTGLIRLRRVLTGERAEFTCTGERPAVVDMPALWTHSITNIGDEPLVTAFWTNELFDPQAPDTWPDPVDPPGGAWPVVPS